MMTNQIENLGQVWPWSADNIHHSFVFYDDIIFIYFDSQWVFRNMMLSSPNLDFCYIAFYDNGIFTERILLLNEIYANFIFLNQINVFSRFSDRTLSKLKLVYHSYRASSSPNKAIVNCQVALVLIIKWSIIYLGNS